MIAITVSSVNGTKSPLEWYARKLTEFAKDEFGLEIKVDIISDHTHKIDNEKLSDTH